MREREGGGEEGEEEEGGSIRPTNRRKGPSLEEVGRERLEELIRGDGTAQQTQSEQSAPATSTATATATATATLTRVWSEEYQRYYVYDPETNESTWE